MRLLGEDFFSSVDTIACHSGSLDSALEHCSDLPRIREIYLDGAQVGDKGTTNLAELHDLEKLDLSNSKVTDAGVLSLRGLNSLKVCILEGTAVSDRAIDVLRKSLPDCEVLADGGR